MHLEKYKAPAVSGVSKHNERLWEGRGFERENIDNSLIGNNYNLAPPRADAVEFVNERIASLDLKRAPRKDAVRMVEWVVTLPEGETDERAFFESTYRHMADEYGSENVIAAWVHLDEPKARPHMHFDFVPVTKDGRLSAKEIVSRGHLRAMHPKMQRLVSADLGHEVPFLLPEEERGRREMSRLDSADYRAAKDEMARQEARTEYAKLKADKAREREQEARAAAAAAEERLEGLRQAETGEAEEIAELNRAIEQARLQPPAQSVFESARTLYEARGDGEREEVLRGEIEGLRARVSQLEGERDHLKQRVGRVEQGVHELRAGVRGLRARLGFIRQAVFDMVGAVIAACQKSGVTQIHVEPRGLRTSEIPDLFRGAAAEGFGPAYTPPARTPNEVKSRAVAATRAADLDRRQRGSSHSRGRGIDR